MFFFCFGGVMRGGLQARVQFSMEAPVVPKPKAGRGGGGGGGGVVVVVAAGGASGAAAGGAPRTGPTSLGAGVETPTQTAGDDLAAKAARRRERNKQSAAASRARQAQRLTDLSSEFEQLKVGG